ncbi:flagellar biosynthesis protein [Rhodanobacter sp. PCA2]|uniref:flagellar biosynthesis protein n=1 Tax=Rhodanobacter sp. PCA2 TaxID=2006117 RepID=UPI0015E7540D|nr:flagellar biosynthesis protein [Rhodanobacter sp. PCA2]MBA2077219.1 flagellar biosynthesis protein [Rhodanobacter sp. PCA2]
MSAPAPPPPTRRVSLRLSAPGGGESRALPNESLETLRARAQALGLPLHPDPQIAALLAGLRLREDVPALLYAAAASLLAAVYDAADEQG